MLQSLSYCFNVTRPQNAADCLSICFSLKHLALLQRDIAQNCAFVLFLLQNHFHGCFVCTIETSLEDIYSSINALQNTDISVHKPSTDREEGSDRQYCALRACETAAKHGDCTAQFPVLS